MRYNIIMWIEKGTIYKAIYYAYLEKMIIRTVDEESGLTQGIVYIREGMTEFDWNVFKLGVLKWKH